MYARTPTTDNNDDEGKDERPSLSPVSTHTANTTEHRLGIVHPKRERWSFRRRAHFISSRQSGRMGYDRSSMGKQECTVDCRLDRTWRQENGHGLSSSSAMHSPTRTVTPSCKSNLIEDQSTGSSVLIWINRTKRTSIEDKI